MKYIKRKFKKCFITGITGSGGSYLCETILEKDSKIRIYGTYRSEKKLKQLINFLKENPSKKISPKRVSFFKLNLKNKKKLQLVLKKTKPDLIYNLAFNADVRKSFDLPAEIITNNNLITINLFESIRILKLKSLIITCSSSEVYGNVTKSETPIKENQPMRPVSPYAVSKAFQDLMSQVYYRSYGLNIIITRMFSYSNARRENLFMSAFAKQIVDIEKGRKKTLKHGNLDSVRCVQDIADAMNAYWQTALYGKVGEIYNIGGDHIITVKSYLKNLIKLSKKKIVLKLDRKRLRLQDVTYQIPNVNKFKKDVKWKTKVDFSNSIKNLLNEFRKIKK